MGASGSKTTNDCQSFDNVFSQNEMETLEKVYMKMCKSSKQSSSEITLGNIPEGIRKRLYKIMMSYSEKMKSVKKPDTEQISRTGFFTVLTSLLRGTTEDRSYILFQLSTDQDTSSGKHVHSLISTLLNSYFHNLQGRPENSSWSKVAKIESVELLCKSLMHDLEQSDSNLHPNDVLQWLIKSPVVVQVLQQVFEAAFGLLDCNEGRSSALMPFCKNIDSNRVQSILNMPAILYLNQHLPASLRTEWRYLFSSRHYGESFSQFLGKVLKQGPTLLFVKDKQGHIFGGFASESWQMKPQFSGNSDCFLFSIFPMFAVYQTTGFNDHYMYLNLHQQTMPNGLGMGGQLGYFGLWLDSDYGKGSCTKSCTTYTSPQMSSCAEFEVDTIEAWAVGPLPQLDEEEEDGKRSILDKVDEETKMILRLADRAPISDVIREEDARETH